MSAVLDIVATYRAPRAVFRRRAGAAPREDRAIAILLLACGLIFIAQWPRLSRLAFETGAELQPMLGGALFGWMFIAPLALYAIGFASHLIARLLGGHGSGYHARFALFWALLAASPLWLLWGLVAGFIGDSPALTVTGIAALGAFLMFWALGFYEAEWGT